MEACERSGQAGDAEAAAVTTEPNETYLGDGLYASFDGFQFCLRAPREDGDHVVYLDPTVIMAFHDYVERTARRFTGVTVEGDGR